MAPDPRLARLETICLALPDATCEHHQEHARFAIRGRTFAWYLNGHQGDGRVSVWCRVGPGDHVVLASWSPERFFIPPYVGSRGWVALRLDVGEVDWGEVTQLVRDSYRRIAPRRLAASVTVGA